MGCFQRLAAPEATEAAGHAGLDFVIIDLEHGRIGPELLGNLVRAAEVALIAPVVRIPEAHGPTIGGILDAGAQGIVVPHVQSGPAAEAVVTATRFPPYGHRSAVALRATGFGRKLSMAEFLGSDTAKPAVIAMVEDEAGVKNAADIAGTDGVDALLVGTTDLSFALGVPGDTAHPNVVAGIEQADAAARLHGISLGVPVRSGQAAAQARTRGATFVATDDISTLLGGLERFHDSAADNA